MCYTLFMPFIKGIPNCKKGLKTKGEWRNCIRCNKLVWFFQTRLLNGGGKYCSRDCSNKSTAKKGQESPNWKSKVGYHAVHDWIQLNYGKANMCEDPNCKKISQKYEWAKVKDVPYERKRENFIQLCKSCHSKYDIKENTYKNKKHSEETKRKLSTIVTNWWNNKKTCA